MVASFRLYLKFIHIAIRTRLQYRSDFLVGLLSVILHNGVNLALIWVILQRFQSLAGWVFWEVVMLYSMWLLSHTVYAIFFGQILQLEQIVIQGNFDQYLLRPTSPFLQLISREVNYMGLGDFILATTIFWEAYRNLNLHWSGGQFLHYALAILAGAAIETSIYIIIGTVAFWAGRSNSLTSVVVQFYILAEQYPLDLFGQSYKLFVTIFLPIAFINYYPLAQLLGKKNALGIPLLGLLSPLVAIIMVSLAATAWHYSLLNYTSSGN